MNSVIEVVRSFLLDELDLDVQGRILVALSGGGDSICLLHSLHSIGLEVWAAHVNYRLRPESDEEEVLVRDVCAQLGIPIHVHICGPGEVGDMEGSVQMAAREIRYEFFRGLLEAHSIAYCATAHHHDDQIETLLLSLLRGGKTGILNAIPPMNGPFLRPLLGVTKEEILAYNRDNGLKFAHDSSNDKRDYLRNKIRLDVLPLLKEINPSVDDRLLRFRENLDLRDEYLKVHLLASNGVTKGTGNREGEWRIRFDHLEMAPKYWPLVLDQVLKAAGFTGTQIRQAYSLIEASSGKRLEWEDKSIYRDQEGVVIRDHKIRKRDSERIHIKPSEISLSSFAPGGIYYLDVGVWSVEFTRQLIDSKFKIPTDPGVYCMDIGKLGFPIRVRKWKEGDRMQPFGMSGRKKISDIFIDEKISREEKDLQLVLEDQEQIVLLGGYRISEAVRLDSSSPEALVVRIKKIDFKPGNDDVQDPEKPEI